MKRRRLGLWSILILMVLLILRSKAVQAGVRSGLALCGRVLIPALFPFSVLSGLLLRSGGAAALGAKADGWMRRRFHLPGQAAAPLLTGLMGGYPLGAQSLAALYKAGGLTKSEAVALSAFCNHPGPAFLVGAVGASVLGEPTLGLWLWGVTVCSALLTGILFSPEHAVPAKKKQPPAQEPACFRQLPAAIRDGAMAMLRVCGTVVLFSGLQAAVFPSGLSLPDWAASLLTGAMELTSGVVRVGALPRPTGFLLAAVLTGWGGLCVHMQAADALLDAGLPIGTYFAGKAAQAILSGLIAFALLPILFPAEAAALRTGAVCVSALTASFIFLPEAKKGIGKHQALCYNKKKSRIEEH